MSKVTKSMRRAIFIICGTCFSFSSVADDAVFSQRSESGQCRVHGAAMNCRTVDVVQISVGSGAMGNRNYNFPYTDDAYDPGLCAKAPDGSKARIWVCPQCCNERDRRAAKTHLTVGEIEDMRAACIRVGVLQGRFESFTNLIATREITMEKKKADADAAAFKADWDASQHRFETILEFYMKTNRPPFQQNRFGN